MNILKFYVHKNSTKKIEYRAWIQVMSFYGLREAIFKNHAGPKIDPFKFWENHHYYFFSESTSQKTKEK